MKRFSQNGKLSLKFIGSYEVLERIGEVAYRVTLTPYFEQVHNVFHVSMLRPYIHEPSHVIQHEPLQLRDDLTYEEKPIEILDRRDKVLSNKTLPLVKVL